ncbi:MAG TPA: formate dehydrogenase accessory sulfurtransferase FdhD [Acidimicrobiales bacterium]|nr:formate dehydrogenase accessory sulfurtransferase FdhD [Acidimicrobiales bacterium]
MSRLVMPTNVVAVRGDRRLELPEQLAAEEPMEIRVAGPGDEPTALGVTMRTPGHDFELAAGFLRSEGVVASDADISSVRYCDVPPGEEQRFNVVTVRLTRPAALEGVQRASSITASCGVCGTATLDQLRRRCDPLPPGPSVAISTILGLPDVLRSAQQVFDQTGGLHAAGLADADGTSVMVREDVGRHNAVDKLVGRSLLDGALPLLDRVLVVSGRVSFEIVQKAALAGLPVIAAVSAPSSLAVTTARDLGITLVAFIRPPRANVYSHPERVDFAR